MSKKYQILLAVLGLILLGRQSAEAQHAIRGKVVGAEGQPLEYTTVTLMNPQDSVMQYFGVTNAAGAYQIKNIKEGTYILQFSFVAMQTTYENIEVPVPSGEDLGLKQLQPTTLDEVVVEAELIPVKFKNDTLEFDVRAFKTRPGAAAEEVLRQLPGIEVDNAGNVKAEGEEVVKVMVEGKEFFDDDPKVATKNLPAEALSKVQVIDRKTEEALFTGIDNGVREKTINLVLKEDHKKGYFGNVEAGVGTSETYRLEGKVYRFTENTQHALLGLYNNINEFGFTNKDNNEFNSNNKGVNTALAGGLNLSFNPTDQNRYFINYLGNQRVKDLAEEILTENFLVTSTYQQEIDLKEEDTDRPHNITAGIRHSFNEQQRLILDAKMNLTNSDIMTQSFTQTSTFEQLVNAQQNETNNTTDATRLNVNSTYIAKFNQERTQFTAKIGSILNNEANRLDLVNDIRFFDPEAQMLVEQFQTNDQERLYLYAEPSLLQKIDDTWSISGAIRFALDDGNLVRREGVLNDNNAFDELAIPDFTTRQRIVSPGLTINRIGKKSQLNVQLASMFNQFNKGLNAVSLQQENYFFWTPSVSYRNEYRSGRRINLNYSTGVTMPTVEQLIPVQNVVNPLNIIEGNPDLEPEFRHNLFINWTVFDQFSFTSLSLRLGGNYTEDKIRWRQIITDDLIQISRPVNVDNDVNLNAYLDFSTPIRSLGLNINLTALENWNQRIVFINEARNINTNFTHQLRIALENRKNDILSIRLSGGATVTDTRFSISDDQNNVYFNTNYTADVRYSPGNRWNFEAQANIVRYDDQSFGETVFIPLLSAEASYFFLNAERASFTLRAFDLLNQFAGLQRISDTNFLLQREWNTLTQYLMLSFNLRFR